MPSTEVLLAVGAVVGTSLYFLYQYFRAKPVQPEVVPNVSVAVRGESVPGKPWPTYTVDKIESISHDSSKVTLALPEGASLVLPLGRHIMVRATVEGETVIRPYTPISLPEDITRDRKLTLVVKKYGMGKMSRHICGLSPGAKIELRGPIGNFKVSPNMFSHLALIAAGSGLTPVLQVARGVLGMDDDKALVTIVYVNRTEDDILCRDMVETLSLHPRCRVILILTRPPSKEWVSTIEATEPTDLRLEKLGGYINAGCLKPRLGFTPQDTSAKVGVCGPGGFTECVQEALTTLGFTKEQVHVF